jgi:hypothetical protein
VIKHMTKEQGEVRQREIEQGVRDCFNNSVAFKMAEQKDEIIRAAITKHLKTPEWTLAEVGEHAGFHHFPDGVSSFFYDGTELLLFYPVKTEVEKVDGKHIFKVTESYQIMA